MKSSVSRERPNTSKLNFHQNLCPSYFSQLCWLRDHIRLFVYCSCCCTVALPVLWAFCRHLVVFCTCSCFQVWHRCFWFYMDFVGHTYVVRVVSDYLANKIHLLISCFHLQQTVFLAQQSFFAISVKNSWQLQHDISVGLLSFVCFSNWKLSFGSRKRLPSNQQ